MMFRRYIITAIACIVLMLTAISVGTAEEIGTLEEYQAVLDELNAEYGYNVHFPTEEEKKKYGIETKPIEMSVEEYRRYMRRMILADMAANFPRVTAAAEAPLPKATPAATELKYTAKEDQPVVIGTLDEYQAVLDELNAEYGYNVHFPTEEEKEKYGIVTKPIEMSVEEYRKYMRRMILADMAANFPRTTASTSDNISEVE